MLQEGAEAPAFELSGVVDGDIERVSLDDLLDESLAVLVFYPGDFNPACSEDSSDLDRLDVFGLQQDATIAGISGDSVYSHQVFAERYNITMPLLADVHSDVAEEFGVTVDDEGYPTKRAVFIIDSDHTINYTWSTNDVEREPDIDGIQQSFADSGDLEIVRTAYQEGREYYDDAWNAWIEAMVNFERREWVLARKNFDTARDNLEEARESFNKAQRFSDTDEMESSVEFAQLTTRELGYAVDLFIDAAAAHAKKNHNRVQRLQPECEVMAERIRTLEPLPPTADLPFDRTATELERRLEQAEQIAKIDIDYEEDEVTGEAEDGDEEWSGLPSKDTETASASNDEPSLELDAGGNAPSLSAAGGSADADWDPMAGGRSPGSADSQDWTRGQDAEEVNDDELEAISSEIEESEANLEDDEEESGFQFGAK